MNYCYYIFTPKGVNYFLQYLLLIFFRGQALDAFLLGIIKLIPAFVIVSMPSRLELLLLPSTGVNQVYKQLFQCPHGLIPHFYKSI